MSDDATPGPTPFDDVPADKQPKAGQSEYGQSEYGQSDGTAGSTGPDQFGTAAQGPAETVERPRESFPPPPPETQAAPPRHVMVSDPAADPAADPATDAAGWGGGNDLPPPVEGSGTDFPTHRTKAGTTAAIIALGTGLLGAAAIITATRARADGELDWSNYGVGLGACVVLLGIAVLAATGRSDIGGRAREDAVTWPGVVGILATAVLVVVGINDDEKWVVYLIGAIIAVLALVGYLMAKRGAFVVVGILGLALIYATLVEDILGDTMDGDNGLVVSSAALGAFVVGVTVLGWLLPSRALTGVVVGVVGVVGYAGILAGLLVARFLSGMFAFAGPDFGGADGQALGGDPGFRESDVWWVLVFAAVLTVLWALAASITNNPGFTVLAIAMPVLVVPLATAVLAAEKPSLWAAILAAGGGILLIGGVGITHLRGKKVARVQQSPQ